jgi:hypothetical protein
MSRYRNSKLRGKGTGHAPLRGTKAAQAAKYASVPGCQANTILLGNLFGGNINAYKTRQFFSIKPQFG